MSKISLSLLLLTTFITLLFLFPSTVNGAGSLYLGPIELRQPRDGYKEYPFTISVEVFETSNGNALLLEKNYDVKSDCGSNWQYGYCLGSFNLINDPDFNKNQYKGNPVVVHIKSIVINDDNFPGETAISNIGLVQGLDGASENTPVTNTNLWRFNIGSNISAGQISFRWKPEIGVPEINIDTPYIDLDQDSTGEVSVVMSPKIPIAPNYQIELYNESARRDLYRGKIKDCINNKCHISEQKWPHPDLGSITPLIDYSGNNPVFTFKIQKTLLQKNTTYEVSISGLVNGRLYSTARKQFSTKPPSAYTTFNIDPSNIAAEKIDIQPIQINVKNALPTKYQLEVVETQWKTSFDCTPDDSKECSNTFTLGHKLPIGKYTIKLLDTGAQKYVGNDSNLEVSKSGGGGGGAKGCTEQDIKDKKCTSAGGITCSDGTDNGIKTAIGCVPTQPEKLIEGLMKFFIGAGGGIALLLMIFGAIEMMTSQGNPEGLKAGRERFTSAVIGLLFIIFSITLLQIIGVDILQLPDFAKAP